MNTSRRKPTGYVATCQCGLVVGAIDLTRTERKEAGRLLGQWVSEGCTLAPRFTGTWSVHVEACQCNNKRTP